MLPEITLIAGSAVDWHKFVGQVNLALGRSPTRELDNCGIQPGLPSTYVAALAEFAHEGSNPVAASRDADRLLTHLSFSFFVSCDPAMAFAVFKQSLGLSILGSEPTRGRENFVVTANLRDWKSAVVEASTPASPPEVRAFYNQVWVNLDKLGFREIFSKFYRKDMRDHTFSLEHKK